MLMKYSIYDKIIGAAVSNMDQEDKNLYLPNAFSFYLENIHGSNNDRGFSKMCEDMGLMEKQKESKLSIKEKSELAIERSKKIIEMDKRRRAK